jgi:hypothetical protein
MEEDTNRAIYTNRLRFGRPIVMGVEPVINESGAEIVRRIFELRGTGLSCYRIAKLLNAEHVPVPKPRSNNESISWTHCMVQAIINNTRYLGRIFFGHTRRLRHPESGKTVIKRRRRQSR